jgi:acyl-CoA synthetase (AMP-forming)/AMP-acid ligase II
VTALLEHNTVYARFSAQARRTPDALALRAGGMSLTYADLLARVERCAGRLRALGALRGERVAVLSENRPEYTIVQLAAAKLGALVACLNWRLTVDELRDSLATVEPRALIFSTRFETVATTVSNSAATAVGIESLCGADGAPDPAGEQALPDDGLLIIFTSGTTGRPRAAVISQRAEVARMRLLRRDLHIEPEDAFIAWSPMFHMGGSEHTLSSLMFGAPVVICDGLEVAASPMRSSPSRSAGYCWCPRPSSRCSMSCAARRSRSRASRSSAAWPISCPRRASPAITTSCARPSSTASARRKPGCRHCRDTCCRSGTR